jgi:uncharacterized membrane protein YfcA
MNWEHNLILFGAAALGGAVNSVAGGGTLLTFPALLWTGQSALIANATSTVALWPGQLSSLWGYRQEVGRSRRTIVSLAVPSLLGGWAGAQLLLHTNPKTFEKVVPFLILAATLLFMANEPLSRWLKHRMEGVRAGAKEAGVPVSRFSGGQASSASGPALTAQPTPSLALWLSVMAFQFGVAVYGGYFGAGIGILMLAALGLMGFTNIHQMNGLKNINGMCINAIAAGMFIVNGLVDWRTAAWMAVGAILGGYCGAGTARRIGQRNVRRIVILIGLLLTVQLLWKSLT